MNDQDSNRTQYDPAYLLYKSNPALFENIPDFTNPRNVYSLISKRRAKSHDDVSMLSKSVDSTTTGLPRITRTTSMRELHHAAGIRTVSRKGRHHSSQNLSSLTLKERKDPSITALFINAPYLNLKDLGHLPEVDTHRTTRTVFPTISSKNIKQSKVPAFSISGEDKSFSLPRIRSDLGEPLAYGTHGEERAHVIKKRIILQDGSTSVIVENKLDKWFSEMPPDVKEKADKVTTEESANQSDNQTVQQTMSRKCPKERVQLPVLKPLNTIPNQFLELRENVSRPVKRDVIIDREQYKLKQRSMLQLKMLDVDENARSERHRTQTETEVCMYQYDADRFHPQEPKTTLKDLINAKKQDGDGIKTVSIDEFAVEAYDIHPNEKFNFAKQIEDNHVCPSVLSRARTSVDFTVTRHRNSHISSFSEDRMRPYRSERTWHSAKLSEQPLNRTLTVVKIEKPTEDSTDDQTVPESRQPTPSGTQSSVSTKDGRSARPPTRDSYQECNKSGVKREVLKFKKLNVFGDDSSHTSGHTAVSGKPLVKFDLRRPIPGWQRSSEFTPHPPIPWVQRNLKTELPATTFQFSTGEVVISRNTANAVSPPRDHQRHSFYPKRGAIKPSNSTTPSLPRSDSLTSAGERTNQPPAKSALDDASSDYTMTPDFRNISEFNLTGRGRPRGRLWDFDGDIPHPESLLGSRKNTIEEIPEETMDQLSPDPPVNEPPREIPKLSTEDERMKSPSVNEPLRETPKLIPTDDARVKSPVNEPSRETLKLIPTDDARVESPSKHSSNTTPLDELPSPSQLQLQTETIKMGIQTENKISCESPMKNHDVKESNEQVVPLAATANKEVNGEEVKAEVNEDTTDKSELVVVLKKTKRDVATSASSLIEANAKRQAASSKNTDHSNDSVTQVFGN
ncbi:uncharacterized protein LOC125677385 isoform X2 [Ostrea edulis]|nr:uncharacterized protein LOC125677385 isoform X2 [Ostrea edulis]